MPVRQESMKIVNAVRMNLESCILGKSFEIQLLITALLAGGHVLIEDVPGTGKTQLIRALSRSMSGEYRRIQCNPDILPSDITGVSVYHPRDEMFHFRPGPVMTNILLADEINRAPAKTQSALLEVMQEQQITIDGESLSIDSPFMVLATQNPLDQEGTYPLPEAELDRFMMKVELGFPSHESEVELLKLNTQIVSNETKVEQLPAVLDAKRIAEIKQLCADILVDEQILNYAVDIVRSSRTWQGVLHGAGLRASINIIKAAKVMALMNGRDFVTPDDVKSVSVNILRHRLILSADLELEGVSFDEVINAILASVEAPRS